LYYNVKLEQQIIVTFICTKTDSC